MEERYAKSLSYAEVAKKVTPGGAQTRSKMPSAFVDGAFPVSLLGGQGSKVWDVDGHTYIDWICGLGAVSLGYGHSSLRTPIVPPTLSLPHPIEAEAATTLIDMIPCAEMVRFTKTGSEACAGAIRIARMATGRDHVVISGYHGWLDWCQPISSRGVPFLTMALVSRLEYGVIDQLKILLEENPVAALMMEAVTYDPPPKQYLIDVKELCHRYGALLIFDENVTGFRWSNGGAQEYFGVTPDLAVFGKAMANGYPLAAVTGRRDLMRHATEISGTFGGETHSLFACQSTLETYRKEAVIEHIWDIGSSLQRGLKLVLEGTPFGVSGYPCKPRIVTEHRGLMSLFLQEMAREGILLHPGGLCVSYAHSGHDVVKTLDKAEEAIRRVERAMEENRVEEALKGRPYEDTFRSTGHRQ